MKYYISSIFFFRLGLFQKKIPGRGRQQALYFSMGGWCGKFSNYMGGWCGKFSNYMGRKKKRQKKTFCGFSMGRNQYWAGRAYDLCVYYMTGTPEGSTESGFMEKPEIEPATPGLQGIALIHYTIWVVGVLPNLITFFFVAVFLGCTSTGRVGLCFLWFYVQELPKAQLAVVLVLKRLRRRGNGLKSHPTDWEKPGIDPATPGLQDIDLSPSPRQIPGFLDDIRLCKALNI